MRPSLPFGLVTLAWSCALAVAGAPLLVSSDVATTESTTSATLQPSQIFRYNAPPGYTLALAVAGAPTLDAIHKLDGAGKWLFSVETTSELGGALGGSVAHPQDVILHDAGSGTYSLFFCGVSAGVPESVNVDALYLLGGDTGDLILSFDVPASIGRLDFDPADLVRFQRTGAACGAWALAAANPAFDASAAGNGIPRSSNVIGADPLGTAILLSFDAPTDLGPPGSTTYLPGQIVSWDGASFALFDSLSGWPISSRVDGLSEVGNPGMVPPTLMIRKAASSTDLVLAWSASCSEGAVTYGIYEGTLGSWYSHTRLDCSDDGAPRTEQITPGSGSRYYLVVPQNGNAEGSYGNRRDNPSSLSERPVGTAQCIARSIVTPCPP